MAIALLSMMQHGGQGVRYAMNNMKPLAMQALVAAGAFTDTEPSTPSQADINVVFMLETCHGYAI